MSCTKLLTFILLFFLLKSASAQDDSAAIKVPTIIYFTNPETGITGRPEFFSLDTALDDIEIFNPAIRNFYNDLGNIGSASEPMIFSQRNSVLTEFGNNTFSLYQWKPYTVRYYKTNKRFSNLNYHLSGGKEQQISITLTQNIYPHWNVGIDFNRQGSLGFLSNGNTFITNFDFFTWFHLPNNLYHAFFSATWNSIKNEVSGGLKNDSLYNSRSFSNTDLQGLGVWLIDAEHRKRNHVFSLHHYYDIVTRKDTAGLAIPFLRLNHVSEYERSSYTYFDNNSDSAYYDHNYFSDALKDSSHFDQWVNKISLQSFLRLNNFKPIHLAALEVGGGYQWFAYEQLFDTTLINYFTEARVRTSGFKNKTTLDVNARYVLNGDNENDYLFRLSFGFPLPFGAAFHIGLQDALQTPGLFAHQYYSDHYIWDTKLDKISSQQYFIGIDLDKYHFKIEGTSYTIGRYLYFNTLGYPTQSLDSIRLNQLFVQKDFSFWKLRLNNSLWIQQTTSDEVRVPEFLTHHSLFYEDIFFKGRLASQMGFDVHYTSGYYSNSYSPAASVFYMQDSIKTHEYPLIDLFINFKIKRARIFLKFQNLFDNVVGDHYWLTPGYPMPGMVFQFGINWRFYD